jgi:hypothetical protein
MKPLVICDYMLFSQSFILALNMRQDTKNIASLAVRCNSMFIQSPVLVWPSNLFTVYRVSYQLQESLVL